MKTLGLCVIVKDDSEAENLKKLLDSCVEYVDGIYITGNNEPQEAIKAVAENYGASYSFKKWTNDFSVMRNFNFGLNKCDYTIWADTDDEIINADKLPSVVEKMEELKANVAYMMYNYAQTGEDKVGIADHDRPRIVLNDGKAFWDKSIHETLNYPDEQAIYERDVYFLHNYEKDKKYEKELRNYKILLAEYNRDGENTDPRTLHYLGNSSYGLALEVKERDELLEQAIHFYSEHIKRSGWPEESYKSYTGIGCALSILGRYDQAINALLKATEIRPDWDEAYWLISKAYLDQEMYDKAIEFGEIALIKKEPNTPLTVDKYLRRWTGPVGLILAYLYSNQPERASALFNKVNPHTKESEDLGKIIQEHWEMNDYLNKVSDIVLYTKKYDKDSISRLVENLPDHVMQQPMIQELRYEYATPRIWPKKSVAIMCGNSLEDWADPSLVKGIGGSETAVIYLSRELVKKGYSVTVFNRCGKLKGKYKGVDYRPYWEFNPKDEHEWLISWRNPDLCRFVKAKQLWLWNHDKVDSFEDDVIEKTDKFIFLSRWQAEQTNIPEEKWFLTSNGIKFYDQEEKDPYMAISTSSYDRGLEHLLKSVKTIRKVFPKFKLHVCYGWGNYDKMGGDPVWKAKMVKLMKQKGVVDHGRVGEKELAKLIAKSSIWPYYSHFWEINCISAIMAQSLGAIPVCTDYAALNETVQGGIKVPGIKKMGEMPKTVLDSLVKETINLLKDKKKQEELRQKGYEWANNYSWENIANNWIKEKEKND